MDSQWELIEHRIWVVSLKNRATGEVLCRDDLGQIPTKTDPNDSTCQWYLDTIRINKDIQQIPWSDEALAEIRRDDAFLGLPLSGTIVA